MPTRYYHTGIVAEDPERIASFYVDVFECTRTGARHDLGGEPLSRGIGYPGSRITGLDLMLPGYGDGGPILEIFRLGNAVATRHEVDAAGLMHLAFSVEDVEATLARVIAAGGSRLGEIAVLEVDGVGAATMVYARDPEGNIVEIQRWDPPRDI